MDLRRLNLCLGNRFSTKRSFFLRFGFVLEVPIRLYLSHSPLISENGKPPATVSLPFPHSCRNQTRTNPLLPKDQKVCRPQTDNSKPCANERSRDRFIHLQDSSENIGPVAGSGFSTLGLPPALTNAFKSFVPSMTGVLKKSAGFAKPSFRD